ncbi:MAG: HRDC domain-containing protein [Chloroflexota bacterium]
MSKEFPPATYIDTTSQLRTLMDEILASEPQSVAIDTESNSMYAYRGQVCLIQLSTRTADYIIDPFPIENMQAFGNLLAEKRIEKIFHAADYDLICIKRDFDFEVHNIFDTMVAARMLKEDKFGLADLLATYFDVEVDKSHQRDDWGARPLPKDSLKYAQMDTHYLHELRDLLYERLAEQGHADELQEIFDDVLRIEVKDQSFDPHGFWKLGRPRSLTRRQMSLLRELYILRDDLAKEEDQPPFKVISNRALVNMARRQPRNFSQLYQIKGLGAKAVRYYGDDILDAIDTGKANRPPKPPPPDRPDPVLADRYVALHAWRKQTGIERGLDSSLILSKDTLWELAREMPITKDELAQIVGIGEWRLANYGNDLLALIRTLD